MKKKRLSATGRAILMISVLLLAVDAVLGYVLVRHSKTVMKTMINARMLDISNMAAAMLDGEALKNLAPGEEDTPEYRQIYDSLRLFQDKIDLEYIYTVRDIGSGAFIFLVDPAPENASTFGELVEVTPALKAASLGTASVDEEPYEDSYGRFYSAYSPVYDKVGRVGGIVAVDFNAAWYNGQVASYTGTALVLSFFSLAAGTLIVILAFSRLRRRFRALNAGLDTLKGDLGELAETVGLAVPDGEKDAPDAGEKGAADELGRLGARIQTMHSGLRQCIEHGRAQENDVIAALASDYRGVYYVDLDTDEGVCYRAQPGLEKGLREGEKFSFRDAFTDYAEKYVAESCREGFLHFIQRGAIRAALDRDPVIAYRYLAVKNGRELRETLRIAGVRHPEDRVDGVVHTIGVSFADADRETGDGAAIS